MYSHEIKEYIEKRNYVLTSEEVWFITDITLHPQINHIIFKENHYEMWDNNGEHFIFYCKPYVKVLK